jgi:hypothetical protein
MNKKVTLALALTCLLAAGAAILYLMDEVLFIDSGEIEYKPAKSTRTPSGTHDSGGDQVKLAWDSVPGARSYNIYWSTSPKVTKENGNKIPDVTNPYIFKGVKNATTYYFVVTAVNEQGESAVSAEIPYTAVDR